MLFRSRLPSLGAKLRARKAVIEIWNADNLLPSEQKDKLGLKGSPTKVHRIVIPGDEGRKGIVIRNAPDKAVTAILQVLEEQKLWERRE